MVKLMAVNRIIGIFNGIDFMVFPPAIGTCLFKSHHVCACSQIDCLMIDYCRLHIEYLRNSIDFNRKDRATCPPYLLWQAGAIPQIANIQFGSPINRDFRFTPTGFAGLGLISAHPETGVFGFALSALSI